MKIKKKTLIITIIIVIFVALTVGLVFVGLVLNKKTQEYAANTGSLESLTEVGLALSIQNFSCSDLREQSFTFAYPLFNGWSPVGGWNAVSPAECSLTLSDPTSPNRTTDLPSIDAVVTSYNNTDNKKPDFSGMQKNNHGVYYANGQFFGNSYEVKISLLHINPVFPANSFWEQVTNSFAFKS
jgi:hypothetical protein